MTRELHADTRVQRGDPGDVPATTRRLGYEPSDAPVGRVLAAMAVFLAVLLVGLGIGFAAQARFGAPVPAVAHPLPEPRLLADPPSERARIEQAARARLDERRLRAAMRDQAARGWDGGK